MLFKKHIILAFALMAFSIASAQQIAFPGAEGYGKYTKGGRGGAVYEVTNLNDSGTGSLRAAVQASGPRTVVFRVSGTITLKSDLRISNPYITIAGQTAPGDGICLRKYPLTIDNAQQVIIRYLRVRFGDESGVDADAISARGAKNVILDHVSASWSVDETMSIYHCDSVTIQWCMISESMFNSNHIKGAHGFGGIWGSNNSTYHHNLLADHASRNPRMASGTGNFDYRNNVVYNWGYNSTYGGENQQAGDPRFAFTSINMVANYYKPGPATQPGDVTFRLANPSHRNVNTDYGKWYISDNVMVGNPDVTEYNWKYGVQPDGGLADTTYVKLANPWASMEIYQQTATEAYYSVLDNVGATLPKMDTIDKRIVGDTRGGYATYEGVTYKQNQTVADRAKICGIIDSQVDVGGWPELNSLPAPVDTDKDGMPDDWEDAHSLDKSDPNDRNTVTSNGYTMLEIYLNSIEFNYTVQNVQFLKAEGKNIRITWADNYIGEDGFIIEKSTDSINFTVIDTVAKNIKEYFDTQEFVNGNLFYRVVAYQDSITSPYQTEFIKNKEVSLITPPTIYNEDTVQLSFVSTPANSQNQIVTWAVKEADQSKATINNLGQLAALDSGMVEITIQTQDGLNLSDTIQLHITYPTIEIRTPRDISVGDSVQLTLKFTPYYLYTRPLRWEVRQGDLSKATISESGMLKALDSGIIGVKVVTEDNLALTDTLSINISPATGVETLGANFGSFDVYPNPFSDNLEIKLHEKISADVIVKIYNVSGKLMMQTIPNSEQFEIDAKSLPKGTYLLSIQNNGKISNRTLVKN